MTKNNGIERKPSEFILMVFGIALVGFLLWSVSVINRENQTQDEVDSSAVVELEGGVDEVNQLTEDDLEIEQAIDMSFDDQEADAATADGAADNIGGVYEEDSF